MSFGSRPKSTGRGRSKQTRKHSGATSKTQELDQDRQLEARLKAEAVELARLKDEATRLIAQRTKVALKQAKAEGRRQEAEQVKQLDLAFNLMADGSEVSDEEVDRIVFAASQIDHYWKDRGGRRAGEFKAVPLGGSVDKLGRGNDPTRYLAINSSPWHTWGILDATKAGLPGKEFLKHALLRFIPIFEAMTGLRGLIWPVHKKPNNIHPQPWMCCITPPCPRPGKQPKSKRGEAKQTGMLLTHPDRQGRGYSPLEWALVGKPACSLEHLRNAGIDLPAFTGDALIKEKLSTWIADAGKNGSKVLDLEAEKEWAKCIVATLDLLPDFKPFFEQAWKRFEEEKKKVIETIMAEIAQNAEIQAISKLRSRQAEMESEVTFVKEGAQMVLQNAQKLAKENAVLKQEVKNLTTQRDSLAKTTAGGKAEMRRQYEVLEELKDFVAALGLMASTPVSMQMPPQWASMWAKTPSGQLALTRRFHEALKSLPDFPEEAEELRRHAEMAISDNEPSSPSPEVDDEISQDGPKME